MPQDDSEIFNLEGRRLSSAEYSLRHRQVFERAKALRAEFLRELWRQVHGWYQRRLALAQLRALDDVALKDIGLHRSGIEAAIDHRPARAAPQKRQAFAEKPHLCLQRN
jgi:uncharacterized protein YjiS (DUF1127 family)